MNSLIEAGLVDFVSGFLAANEVTCVVHPGTSNAGFLPPNRWSL